MMLRLRTRFLAPILPLIPMSLAVCGFPLRAHAFRPGDAVRSRMMEVLNQVADIVKENYYDPKLKNLDWKADVEVARERIRRADDEGEMAAAIAGLLTRLNDSHTYFLRPTRLQPVIFGFRAKAFGDEVRIYEIMPGGPAEDAGLQRGDRIAAVEGFVANRKLIDDELRYFEYLDPRLTVNLKVARNGGLAKDYVIKGRQPATSSKDFVRLYDDYTRDQEKQDEKVGVKEEEGGVAYLRFPSFMVSTSKVDSLLKPARDARALILDLREDGGGREDAMKEMASHFLSQATPMATAISRDKQEEIVVKPKQPNLTAPLFVLVDSHSASASEIVARLLQLQKRAVIVGDLSAGKVNRARFFGGTGGAVYQIPFGVVVTVSRAVMPDGSELEDHGVVPDVPCVPTEEDLRLGRDVCLEKALALARQAAVGGAH
jgi:carboxyl-terminal processing protease